MAYFGRKPEKPGSVPGSQAGNVEQERAARIEQRLERLGASPRPLRGARFNRAVRNIRAARSAR